ncbi:unnamed protein product, partial [Heterosigma akashiwo]
GGGGGGAADILPPAGGGEPRGGCWGAECRGGVHPGRAGEPILADEPAVPAGRPGVYGAGPGAAAAGLAGLLGGGMRRHRVHGDRGAGLPVRHGGPPAQRGAQGGAPGA